MSVTFRLFRSFSSTLIWLPSRVLSTVTVSPLRIEMSPVHTTLTLPLFWQSNGPPPPVFCETAVSSAASLAPTQPTAPRAPIAQTSIMERNMASLQENQNRGAGEIQADSCIRCSQFEYSHIAANGQ